MSAKTPKTARKRRPIMDNLLIAYKCTRADGTSFSADKVTGKRINYIAHLADGTPIVHPNPDPALKSQTSPVCGAGLHVCDTPRKTIQFADKAHRPYRWFEVLYATASVIEWDDFKMRLS